MRQAHQQMTALSVACMLWLSGSAVAQAPINACVTCTQPDRTYACEVLPPEAGEMGQSPQLFCAREIAKSNNHASCAVVRSASTTCSGQQVTLAYTGPIAPTPETADEVPDAEVAPASDNPVAPPKTLLEATDRAVKSTGRQLKKAGDAIGNTGKTIGDATEKTGDKIVETGTSVGKTVTDAAKSGWNCVISLFQSC